MLEHCPFCGTKHSLSSCVSGRHQQIICGACGARGPEIYASLPYQVAVESWNVRQGPSEVNETHRPGWVSARGVTSCMPQSAAACPKGKGECAKVLPDKRCFACPVGEPWDAPGVAIPAAPSLQEVIAAALDALADNDNHAATVILKTALRNAGVPVGVSSSTGGEHG